MSMKTFFAVLATAAVAAVPAGAQDYRLDPTYTTLTLDSGFAPDPQTIDLQSGGDIDASSISSSCRGFIANAPDVRVRYTRGRYPLIISVDSNADTTLVVNAPDGRWYCDDDSGERGLNPMVRFNNPQSGQYDIWVGTYGNARLEPATLAISEISSQ
ncbi:peptidase S1 [Sphingosinicella ginsenosidimutans]|uniref:Peptidase S1 n=1 Tax=Allosphingosinicella ginsenosidimutans TaxID=1176539 RepID=A0A5C6TTU2_9SPHN|nr:peptidase S1 [Sphingosinicella ginsenosidimutans]TXC63639.1 peptidase S1 [Sphingosinicella ginsenosidimutans]